MKKFSILTVCLVLVAALSPALAQEEDTAEPVGSPPPAAAAPDPQPSEKPAPAKAAPPTPQESPAGSKRTAPDPDKNHESRAHGPTDTPHPSPTPKAEGAGAPRQEVERSLDSAARDFFAALVKGDVEAVTGWCRLPFFFEGKASQTPEELKQRWATIVSHKPLDRYTLYGVDYLSPEEMEAKYGKPPAKLSAVPLKGSTIALGNLGGRATVVVFRKGGPRGWQAVAIHD